MNSPDQADLDHGFRVVCVDPADGSGEVFVRNATPGPASASGAAGIERPVDVEFGPDGALYVLDFGHSPVVEAKTHQSYGRTGVLWRVVREAGVA